MSYMLLIVEPIGQRQTRSLDQGRAAYERMAGFAAELQQRGLLIAVEALTSQVVASRVERRDGQTRVVDGPFAEAKEMVGGFFLVNCTHKADALALAAACPAAEWATVEVRKVGTCYEDS
ncbi:MAG: hypothetical protein RIQ60_997 [Pseudomonadota bacterium]|jgi:hypothetical protein